MQKKSQLGSSLVGTMLAFLMIVVSSGVGFYWISLARHHSHITETTVMMASFFQKFHELVPQFMRQKVNLNTPAYLKSYDLLTEYAEKTSAFDKTKQVFALPLGEADISIKYEYSKLYTYIYLHFFDMYKRNSCRQFLGAKWEEALPESWWSDTGYIGVISENTKGVMYFSYNPKYIMQDGAQSNPSKQHLKDVCNVCRKSRYCSVMFFFELDENKFLK